jgi:hypothetical protein
VTKARKSWHEKLENPVAELPKVVDVPGKGKKPSRVADLPKSLMQIS